MEPSSPHRGLPRCPLPGATSWPSCSRAPALGVPAWSTVRRGARDRWVVPGPCPLVTGRSLHGLWTAPHSDRWGSGTQWGEARATGLNGDSSALGPPALQPCSLAHAVATGLQLPRDSGEGSWAAHVNRAPGCSQQGASSQQTPRHLPPQALVTASARGGQDRCARPQRAGGPFRARRMSGWRSRQTVSP